MSSEVELKLELSSEAAKRLSGFKALTKPAEVLNQTSTYFDFEDQRLFRRGFTLRIRRTGDLRVQTVKAVGRSRSLFARSEWEVPLDGDEPILDHSSPLKTEFGDELAVSPAFDVKVERRLWTIDENGSQIEVAIDKGSVVSGDRSTPLREAELELKDGDPRDLFVFARKIEAVAPIRFGVRSKAEKGFALIEQQRSVFKAEHLDLEQDMPASDAFQAIAASCFRHFRLNEDVLLRQRNAETLHQARVALRRLRSAFSLFKPLLPDAEPQRLKDELRWLAGVLGEARDLDVLLPKATDADLQRRLEVAREAAYDDVAEALESSRARALMLDFNEWLRCGEYLFLPETDKIRNLPAVEFAGMALGRMRKKLKKHGRALAKVDDQQRHEARKDAKKLRYAVEFFASLFDGKRSVRRHRRFLKKLTELQDQLGSLIDLVTGPDVLSRLGLTDHTASDSIISHADKDALIEDAQASLDNVLHAKRFWR
ncbi:CHAD domain-containing protein [Rhizobium mesoamericanum]|uniref:CHAD domain containing protein n=1 Tax=Rhizobium mesoamericanum STM3625 TaxID=1211777 RepID=K0Q1Q1_9HYPH|nr:CHAD domain-containing protein [Rhizobium mesoamericanum]CCM78185.1 CHAD domain containing protein [Rhizobium mesoamericanum STM3625]